METYQITLRCPCGHAYDVTLPKIRVSLTALLDKNHKDHSEALKTQAELLIYRSHKCPKCGFLYKL